MVMAPAGMQALADVGLEFPSDGAHQNAVFVCSCLFFARMIVVLAFMFLFYLLMWHGYLATANVTTIEYFKVSDGQRRGMVEP